MLISVSNRHFLLVFSLMLILLTYFYPLFLNKIGLLYYVVPSVTGLLLIGLLFNEVLSIKAPFEEGITPVVFLFLSIGVANDVILGLISGFGRNPLTLTQSLIILNLVREVPRVFGMELFRGFVLGNSRGVKTSLVVTSFLLTFLNFTYTRYLGLLAASYSSFINFLMRDFTPLFLSNLLVGCLFVLGGIRNSLLYSMFKTLYIYLMPMLPNVSSGVSALVSVVHIFMFFTILSVMYSGGRVLGKLTLTRKLLSVFFVLLLSAVLISVLMGYRALVIVSGSMSPFLSVGDVVIVNTRIDPANILVGDVIAFYLGRDVVVHRVVRILNTSSGIRYVTKGDANDAPDPFKVAPSALLGRYVFKIPTIGYLWIYLMQALVNYQNLVIAATLGMIISSVRSLFRWFTYAED